MSNLLDELKRRLTAVIDEYRKLKAQNPTSGNTAAPANNSSNNPAATRPATSANTISGSVGEGGTNNPDDVKKVQNLLNRHGIRPELVEDGDCGPKTIAAIKQFQELKTGVADGLVEPNRNTWKALLGQQVANVNPSNNNPNNSATNNNANNGGNLNGTLPNGKLLYEDEAVKKHGAAFIAEVKAIGARIKLNPNFIMATMKMESRFETAIVNPASGATGLIQFMPETARGLGTTVEAIRGMSAMQQLRLVERFYRSSGADPSKIKEPAESYLLVFYPFAVGKPDSYVLGSEVSPRRVAVIARQNHIYDLNKDGQITKGEVLEYQRKNKFKEAYELLAQAQTQENAPANGTNQPPANGTNQPPANGANPAVTASTTLSASVGEGGTNKPEDVLLVKTLLNKFTPSFNLADTSTNTKVGPTTIGVIKKFQQEKVGLANPDGRIDVGGRTWKVLNGETPPVANQPANNNVPSGGKIAHPHPGARMTSPYGMRVHPVTGKRRMHRGVDYAKGEGSPIYAAADGKVIHMYQADGGYGRWILMEHANGYTTRYAHLSAYVAANGAQVKKGDVIAREGNTGIGTGSHLHFEVRINGQDVDPAPYIAGTKEFK